MKQIATLRIFADHYQFWIYDGEKNPFEPLLDYTDESVERGWARSAHAISFGTRAHLNDHRLDVFLCNSNPRLIGYDRATVHPLTVSSRLAIHDTEEALSVDLPKREYSLVMAAYNLSKEPSFDEEKLDDDAFLRRLDWERYELYICPSMGMQDGPYKNDS
jgi:hypothetical protein